MKSIGYEFVNKNHGNAKKIAVEFFSNKSASVQLNYETLIQRAQALAQHLIDAGYSNKRLLIIVEPGIDYIIAFWACIFAKAIAVPVMVPLNKSTADSLNHIARDANVSGLLTSELIHKKLSHLYAINKLNENRLTRVFYNLLKRVHKNIEIKINDIPWLIGSDYYHNDKFYQIEGECSSNCVTSLII